MPKFTIQERVSVTIDVEAATAQEALDMWLIHGLGEVCETVEERHVEDEDGQECEAEERTEVPGACEECARSNGPHYHGPCGH